MLTKEQLCELRASSPENRNRLREAIRLAGVTQDGLAVAVEMSQPRISAICAGRFGNDGLPLETARALSAYFGCEVDDLFPAQSEVA